MHQDIATGFEIFRFRTFLFVVAETTRAGYEDHCRRGYPTYLAGIMSGS